MIDRQVYQRMASYPLQGRNRLQVLRRLIYETAKTDPRIGEIEESLKWGQISFATKHPRSGTPVRIDADVANGTYSLFVPCSTHLIEDFRTHHPDMFDYFGNREIRLSLDKPMPKKSLQLFIASALSYYLP